MKDGHNKEVAVDHDFCIIKTVSIEKVSKLKTSIDENGTTTAGNSSQLTDGSAVVLLASEE